MSVNHDVSKLDDLITATIDSARGYDHSLAQGPDTRFTDFFHRMAADRREVVTVLQARSRALGGSPTEQGSAAAAVHRGWEALRAALGGGDRAILQEIQRGEDYLAQEYERALADSGISDETRAVIRSCHESVLRGKTEARTLGQEADAANAP